MRSSVPADKVVEMTFSEVNTSTGIITVTGGAAEQLLRHYRETGTPVREVKSDQSDCQSSS